MFSGYIPDALLGTEVEGHKSSQNIPVLLASILAVKFLGVLSKDLCLSSILIVWILLTVCFISRILILFQICSCFILACFIKK